jgi:hypothetical protein
MFQDSNISCIQFGNWVDIRSWIQGQYELSLFLILMHFFELSFKLKYDLVNFCSDDLSPFKSYLENPSFVSAFFSEMSTVVISARPSQASNSMGCG